MNIEGITVLKTIPAFCENLPLWVCLVVFMVGLIALCISAALNECKVCQITLCVLSLFAIFFSLLIGCCQHPTRYEITVDDTVSYNELCKNYIIIDTDGAIITVQER